MSKFKRKSPEAVRNAVNFKYKIMNIAWLKRRIQEEEEANKKHEERMLLLKGRVDNLESGKQRQVNNSPSCLHVSQKYLFLASILVTASISLLIGVISNAP